MDKFIAQVSSETKPSEDKLETKPKTISAKEDKPSVNDDESAEKVQDQKIAKEAAIIPEQEKPSSVEQAYINEVNKVSSPKKEDGSETKPADS